MISTSSAPPITAGLPDGTGHTIKTTAIFRHLRHRLLGPIRIRLALLVLIAAIPLLLLSGTIAWQNYQLALAATAQTAGQLRESAISQHRSAVSGTEQMLQALAQVTDLVEDDPVVCAKRLADILALQSARYTNLWMADAAGGVRCAARPLPLSGQLATRAQNARLFAVAAQRRGFALGPIRNSTVAGIRVIPAVYPLQKNGKVSGFLVAGLRIDWFARPTIAPGPQLKAMWIADATGQVEQVAVTGALGLPPASELRRLEASPLVAESFSAGGERYAYASGQVTDGYTLIVAYPAALDRVAASSLLFRRAGQLGLLLLGGLAAVAIGTHLALVEPLTQLSQAVARWRLHGRFDASSVHHPPTEVGDMADTFAEATQALDQHAARHAVAVAQQELLMREIHHRVKNNLQIVASLLNLQASRIRLPEARAEFASARDRVRALATLHRHLYMQGEVHTIDMPGFLTELCNQLFQAMGEVPGRRIRLVIEASPLQMSSDQAVPLSLIVTETVSNAVKYAFPKGRTGQVSVRLTASGEAADLVVEDDGVGIPSGRTETESGPRDGIGITLIRGFARQLGATLSVHEDRGTRYTLHVPLIRTGEAQPTS